MSAIIPIPPCELSIRPAVEGDYAFIDRLQDMHSKALGFQRKAAIEENITLGGDSHRRGRDAIAHRSVVRGSRAHIRHRTRSLKLKSLPSDRLLFEM